MPTTNVIGDNDPLDNGKINTNDTNNTNNTRSKKSNKGNKNNSSNRGGKINQIHETKITENKDGSPSKSLPALSRGPQRASTPLQRIFRPDMYGAEEQVTNGLLVGQESANPLRKLGPSRQEAWASYHKRIQQLPLKKSKFIDLTGEDSDEVALMGSQPLSKAARDLPSRTGQGTSINHGLPSSSYTEPSPSREGNETIQREARKNGIPRQLPLTDQRVLGDSGCLPLGPKIDDTNTRLGCEREYENESSISTSRLEKNSSRNDGARCMSPATLAQTCLAEITRSAEGNAQRSSAESHLVEPTSLNLNGVDSTGSIRVSPDMKALKAILKGIIDQTRMDQESLVTALLSRARSEVSQNESVLLEPGLPDPFEITHSAPSTPSSMFDSLPRVALELRGANSRKKHSLIESRVIAFESEAQDLPRYNSITRLRSNVLAQNDKNLKYLPYFPQEEREGEDSIHSERREQLLQGFDNRVKFLPQERRCVEQAEHWRESTEDFLEEAGCTFADVMYHLLHSESPEPETHFQLPQEALAVQQKKDGSCGACGTRLRGRRSMVTLSGQRPDDKALAAAGLICSVFASVMKFSIWHVASTDDAIQCMTRNSRTISTTEQSRRSCAQSLCMVCHVFDCPSHGAYLEGVSCSDDDSGSQHHDHDADEYAGSTSGSEHVSFNNIKQDVALPEPWRPEGQYHRCGVFCVDPQTPCREILGFHGTCGVQGKYNPRFEERRGNPGFDDDRTCSQSCFWDATTRSNLTVGHLVQVVSLQRFVNWDEKAVMIYKSLLAACLIVRRGPCIMASVLDIQCSKVFREMLVDIQMVAHPEADLRVDGQQTLVSGSTIGFRDKDYSCDFSLTGSHRKRSPFVPCSHFGPCHRNVDCTCWNNKIACEWICGCERACPRRFQGCKCVARGSKTCFGDVSCNCFALGRECDPWLCGKCGVFEVLDPVNRSEDQIRRAGCKNAMIQLNIPKRSLKGPSEVHGWGLFAGEDISANAFIGEYKGEIISEEEADRRGLVYQHRGLEYLFTLNKDQEIDASRAGNKMRFINNSERDSTINVYANNTLCNGVQRIGLFARRNIVAGEEMFFRYGYPESLTKHFWEKEDLMAHQDDEYEHEHEHRNKPKRKQANGKAKSRRRFSKQVKETLRGNGQNQMPVRFLEDLVESESDVSPRPRQRSMSTPRRSKRQRRSSPALMDATTLDVSNMEAHVKPSSSTLPASIEISDSESGGSHDGNDAREEDDDGDDDEEEEKSYEEGEDAATSGPDATAICHAGAATRSRLIRSENSNARGTRPQRQSTRAKYNTAIATLKNKNRTSRGNGDNTKNESVGRAGPGGRETRMTTRRYTNDRSGRG